MKTIYTKNKIVSELKKVSFLWLGPNYSDQEEEIFNKFLLPFFHELANYNEGKLSVFMEYVVPALMDARNHIIADKAPRTGFPKPTEKEKKEFEKLFPKITVNPEPLKKLYKPGTLYIDKEMAKLTKSTFPQLFSEKVPQSFFYCPFHKRTKLIKFKSKEGNGQVCIKCNPKLIK